MRSIPISRVNPGPFRVAGVLLPSDQTQRLSRLGLRPGIAVDVLQNGRENGAVIACGDTRIALDGGTAARVFVVSVGGEK